MTLVVTPSGIREALDAVLSALQSTGVAWESVALPNPDPTGFLSTQITARTSTPQGVGPDAMQLWEGVYQVSVHYPIGEGMKPAELQAQIISSAYPRSMTLVAADGTKVTIVSTQIPPAVPSDRFVTIPVLINWFAQEAN